jgi:hypothetical protein
MQKQKRGVAVLLAVSVVLLAVAAGLARCGDERLGVTAPKVKPVEFPRERALREERQQRRAAASAPPSTPPSPATLSSRDRLTRALSSPGRGGAVVFEVNALRHSPLVDALLKCRTQQQGDELAGLELLKTELGIDVTEDVDRVALDAEVLAVSGFFDKLALPPELGDGEVYGDGGRIFTMVDDKGGTAYLAKLGTDLVMTSTSEDELKAAIDRTEGRKEASGTFPDGVVGGEVYGMVGPALLQSLVGMGGGSGQLQGLAGMLTTTKLRMAVDQAAAVSLDIGTKSPEDGAELAKAIGGAVAMARSHAAAEGQQELAAMLEQARVVPNDDGSIAFDLAVPGDELLKLMGCPPMPTPAPSGETPP